MCLGKAAFVSIKQRVNRYQNAIVFIFQIFCFWHFKLKSTLSVDDAESQKRKNRFFLNLCPESNTYYLLRTEPPSIINVQSNMMSSGVSLIFPRNKQLTKQKQDNK